MGRAHADYAVLAPPEHSNTRRLRRVQLLKRVLDCLISALALAAAALALHGIDSTSKLPFKTFAPPSLSTLALAATGSASSGAAGPSTQQSAGLPQPPAEFTSFLVSSMINRVFRNVYVNIEAGEAMEGVGKMRLSDGSREPGPRRAARHNPYGGRVRRHEPQRAESGSPDGGGRPSWLGPDP